MQWYHASDVAYPATWMRLHLYPNPIIGSSHRTRMYNGEGELFYDCAASGVNSVPYNLQLRAVIKQAIAGKARVDGGYFTSYRHVEPEVMEKYFQPAGFFRKIGLDPAKDMWENSMTWHMNVGGVRVNGRTMESEVPGLLVAGSVNALVTGGLPNVMFDGVTAVRSAAERVRSLPSLRPLDESQVAAEAARVTGLARVAPADGLLPGQVKKRIRRCMWENHHYVKTDASIRHTLKELRRIELEDLPRMRLQTDTRRFNYDWVDALDAVDMLRALQIQTSFCLYRQESRGAFYREDFPMTDNENWLVHVVGGRGPDGELRLEKLPVDLPYARPAEKIASFFEVDY